MAEELEAVLRCPTCAVERARVYRKRTANEAVFVNEVRPDINACPDCGAKLERQSDG
jgi:rubredoxin